MLRLIASCWLGLLLVPADLEAAHSGESRPPGVPSPSVSAALALARPDTWEPVVLIEEGGKEFGGDIKVLPGGAVEFKGKGGSRSLVTSDLRAVHFLRPKSPGIATGDRALAKGDFAKALSAYGRAKKKKGYDNHPYLLIRMQDARLGQRYLNDLQTGVAEAVGEGRHRAVLTQISDFALAKGHKAVSKEWQQAFATAWTFEAGRATPAEREQWQDLAKKWRSELVYDENAPQLLAEALRLAGEDGMADVARDAFKAARAAAAAFEDEHWLAYGRVLVELGDRKTANKILQNLSARAQVQPGVADLLSKVGLVAGKLAPELLCLTWVGGPQDEVIEEVGFTATGLPRAVGSSGFTFVFHPSSKRGELEGALGTGRMDKPPSYEPGTGTRELSVPQTGEVLTLSQRQVGGGITQPKLSSSAGWHWWGFPADQIKAASLMSQARQYGLWLLPDKRHVGLLLYCGGGNTTIDRHPTDINGRLGTFGVFDDGGCKVAGGSATLLLKVDVQSRQPVSGTFFEGKPLGMTQDAFGRLYGCGLISRKHMQTQVEDRFGLGDTGKAGLAIFHENLSRLQFNIALGGTHANRQRLGLVAVQGNLLIIAGYTDATRMRAVNPLQDQAGGGLDGLVAVLRLWPD